MSIVLTQAGLVGTGRAEPRREEIVVSPLVVVVVVSVAPGVGGLRNEIAALRRPLHCTSVRLGSMYGVTWRLRRRSKVRWWRASTSSATASFTVDDDDRPAGGGDVGDVERSLVVVRVAVWLGTRLWEAE